MSSVGASNPGGSVGIVLPSPASTSPRGPAGSVGPNWYAAPRDIAGPATSRRAAYQFGPTLPAGPRGLVDAGLGKTIPTDPPGLLAPTEDITHTGQELIVD